MRSNIIDNEAQSGIELENGSNQSANASGPAPGDNGDSLSMLHQVRKTETSASLGATLTPTTTHDVNFPFATENIEKAEFPEEYQIETESGIVPMSSLRKMRQRPSSDASNEDLEKSETDIEFVTFKVDDPENPMVKLAIS